MMDWVVLLLCFHPVVVLFFKMKEGIAFSTAWNPVVGNALSFTVAQALVSALASVLIGLWAAPGFARLSRFQTVARWVLLFPNIISPVLVVLTLLLTFRTFPYGFWGVVVGHVFLNGGLAAIWLGERWQTLEAKWLPVGRVLGARDPYLFRKVILPQMWPQVRYTFAVIFSLCLSSLVIPLVLGGGPQSSTLEVLIYERIHADADISGATTIAVLQFLVQCLVFLTILRPSLGGRDRWRGYFFAGKFSPALIPIILVIGASLVPFLQLIRIAVPAISLAPQIIRSSLFSQAALNSLAVALCVGLVTTLALVLLCTCGWRRPLFSLPALSGVIVGLGGFFIFGIHSSPTSPSLYPALILGHSAVILLPVLRLTGPALEVLRMRFKDIVKQLGASSGLALREVFLPLGKKIYLLGGLLAACWSLGEFSVSSMIAPPQSTLPLYIQSLMSGYRLEHASLASIFLLLAGLVSVFILESVMYGLG